MIVLCSGYVICLDRWHLNYGLTRPLQLVAGGAELLAAGAVVSLPLPFLSWLMEPMC